MRQVKTHIAFTMQMLSPWKLQKKGKMGIEKMNYLVFELPFDGNRQEHNRVYY